MLSICFEQVENSGEIKEKIELLVRKSWCVVLKRIMNAVYGFGNKMKQA